MYVETALVAGGCGEGRCNGGESMIADRGAGEGRKKNNGLPDVFTVFILLYTCVYVLCALLLRRRSRRGRLLFILIRIV